MEMNDPFNYPALNRKDLMSLSTLNQQRDGQKTTTKKFVSNRGASSNLYTLDIEGAQPKLFGSRALNKPDVQNYNADIEELEKPEYNLVTEDIKGTKPNVMKDTIRTKRAINPLAPEYKLPVVEPRPPTPPKFLRDAIKIDDIDGAKPKKQPVYATREFMDNKDIEGAHPKKFKPRTTKYEYIDYSDLTKEEFHTKRVVDPLNPVYNLKDYAGNPINYGNIEGSNPKKLPSRGKGAVSTDLNTQDIIGAQAGTKGLGPFAQKARETIRNNIHVNDIEGAQAGTLRKGLGSKRETNPINPQYQDLGHTQKNLRQDLAYAEPWKEMPVRKTCNRMKPEWQKSTVIPIIEDKKVDTNKPMQESNTFASAANESLRGNMAKFYGVQERDVKERDIQMLNQEANREAKPVPTPKIDPRLQSDPTFIDHMQKFFGNPEDSKAQWESNVNKFYRNPEIPPEYGVQFNLRPKGQDMSSMKPPQGSLYRRDEAVFFGEKPDDRASSRGSVFQKNAAHFCGYETPANGERPFEFPPPESQCEGPKPVLAQRNMKNMPQDPKYQNSMAKFFGVEQEKGGKRKPTTYAERLQKFIAY